MKKILTILLLSLLLFTGCEKRKEEKFEELEKGNETTSTLTTTTSLSTAEPTTSSTTSTTTSTTTTVTTISTKKKTTSGTTTKKNYPVTVNGKGYEIGDTATINIIYKSKVSVSGTFLYVYFKKKENHNGNSFSTLDNEIDYEIIPSTLEYIHGGPDAELEDKTGYVGFGFMYEAVNEGYWHEDKPFVDIDFSKGKKILTVKVKFKKAGEYKIDTYIKSINSGREQEIDCKKDVQVIIS